MFESSELSSNAIIKVIGVGGGGGNAVEHMVRERIEGVEFFAINTDAQALRKIEVGQTIQIGNNITKGLGAGANPEIGRTSAEEDKELLKSALDGSDMVFIAAGMGGGTGTGAAPVVAEIAKELGILTVAVVTKPFNFEGKKRMIVAEQGIIELSKYVDSLITIPNDKLLKVLSRGISLLDAFSAANNVLKGAVQGIAELITRPGLMNVDFADVRTVMVEMGYAMMGTGISSGENRAEEAAEIAISSPLLEDIDLSGARGVLVNITAGFDLKLDEFETVGNTIRSFSSDNATVVIGTSLDPDMNDSLRVTVVATGIGMEKKSDINQIKNKSSREVLMDYRYQYLNVSPTKTDKKNIKKEIKNTEEKIKKEPEYLDIPSFLRKRAD
ncbi:cell division protein FtsZ [Buchnera aphidicola str. Ak (Acyrthosiphon kondoi)]|uniref:Cell division protein FtsZ n=1 Tax=Buchnera aphidicola str. Ak (Acyrthosiphon kondoi) TaxID=1005090 RepID=G2LMT2_9GAMM|nr:cell division protein FtsZ [Buchnera aphidicola]AEO08570.1 cell division protein FtsZ [Buchnera aphidicola str. Ak (Acyrthosiphon kondoi)]WAI18625.1 MAG: cell division protein FtsZ [Buchnera aphidicola (Acyrthosiphon caraganae)]